MSRVERSGADKGLCKVAAGFTLLEVLMTLAILGLILALVVPKYDSAILSSKEQAEQADRRRLEGAVELYRLDTGIFPSSLDDLIYSSSEVHGWRGPYIDKIPTQPNGQPYTLNAQGKVGI